MFIYMDVFNMTWLFLCRSGVICMRYVPYDQARSKPTAKELLDCCFLMMTVCLDTESTSFSVSMSCREDLARTSDLPTCSTLDLFRRRAPCELRDPQDTRALYAVVSVSGDRKVHVGLNGILHYIAIWNRLNLKYRHPAENIDYSLVNDILSIYNWYLAAPFSSLLLQCCFDISILLVK